MAKLRPFATDCFNITDQVGFLPLLMYPVAVIDAAKP
jgi:hypothetical protein